MKASQAWRAVLGQLQIDMPRAAFDTWVKDTELVSYEDGSFIVGVANAYARDWLESHITSTVNRMLAGIMNRSIEVRFIVWSDPEVREDKKEILPVEIKSSGHRNNHSYNPKYTFSSFIVGPSNRLAHAASYAVAELPAKAYNPLFIYGGVGLGKTHLLHAIGNMTQEFGLSVLYVSSEEFTNDLVNAIRTQTTASFREKYRETDVLLIDDIQFIAGKESTQEEFFHTFNTLHGQEKQIVISSDRPPKALNTLEERLCSRFEWGLTADIQHPDFETRLAILRSKAERLNSNIPDDVLESIARRFESNIRELEGALTRLTAFAELSGTAINRALVDSALADLVPDRTKAHPEEIIQLVSDTFDITLEEIRSKTRSRQVALPRQVAMYLLREEAKISLPQIGEMLGGRDHTTIMYGCEKISDLMERDDRLRSRIISIKERIYSPVRVKL